MVEVGLSITDDRLRCLHPLCLPLVTVPGRPDLALQASLPTYALLWAQETAVGGASTVASTPVAHLGPSLPGAQARSSNSAGSIYDSRDTPGPSLSQHQMALASAILQVASRAYEPEVASQAFQCLASLHVALCSTAAEGAVGAVVAARAAAVAAAAVDSEGYQVGSWGGSGAREWVQGGREYAAPSCSRPHPRTISLTFSFLAMGVH